MGSGAEIPQGSTHEGPQGSHLCLSFLFAACLLRPEGFLCHTDVGTPILPAPAPRSHSA